MCPPCVPRQTGGTRSVCQQAPSPAGRGNAPKKSGKSLWQTSAGAKFLEWTHTSCSNLDSIVWDKVAADQTLQEPREPQVFPLDPGALGTPAWHIFAKIKTQICSFFHLAGRWPATQSQECSAHIEIRSLALTCVFRFLGEIIGIIIKRREKWGSSPNHHRGEESKNLVATLVHLLLVLLVLLVEQLLLPPPPPHQGRTSKRGPRVPGHQGLEEAHLRYGILSAFFFWMTKVWK